MQRVSLALRQGAWLYRMAAERPLGNSEAAVMLRALLLLFDSQDTPFAPDMSSFPVGSQSTFCPAPRALPRIGLGRDLFDNRRAAAVG
jgi:hypothetical protein